MSLLRDSRSFRFYGNMRGNLDAPGEDKRSNLLQAVVCNDVITLQRLLETPDDFNVTDKNGLTLLHIAILTDSKDAFSYLLSFPECPLETKSDYGETPLLTSILVIDIEREGRVKPGSDFFALKLLDKADLCVVDAVGNTALACSALKHHVKMAEVFLQNGVDVNSQDVYGNTPLHHALDHEGSNCLEFVTFLLLNGADPTIKNKDDLNPFEKSVLHTRNSHLQETLFNYTYDCYSERKTHLSVIVRLAESQSELTFRFEDAVVTDETRDDYSQLFYVDTEYLSVLAKRFKSVASVLPMCSLQEWSRNAVTLEKIDAILDDAMLARIQSEQDFVLFENLRESGLDLQEMTEVLCYFMSYGVVVTNKCLQEVFEHFGRCSLFEILLYMDVEMIGVKGRIFPTLLYDITIDIGECLKKKDCFSMDGVECLFEFFGGWKLKAICLELGNKRVGSLPDVPVLQELAREVFRKYFLERFGISNSRGFYTLIKSLNIGNVYKKIITYERGIYVVSKEGERQ